MPTIHRSKDFCPSFGALKNLKAFVPSGAPMLATTASVTTAVRNDIIEKLDMAGCCVLTESPNKPNITYEAVQKNTIEEDFNCVVRDVAENNIKAQRVVVSSLYTHFLHALQDASYYPPGAEHVRDN